jgi:hypothetical protein
LFAQTHCSDYFIHFLVLEREKVGEMSELPLSSTFCSSLIFAATHNGAKVPGSDFIEIYKYL